VCQGLGAEAAEQPPHRFAWVVYRGAWSPWASVRFARLETCRPS
jgi:hypothetical protein